MAGTYRGVKIPVANYHGVPPGWRAHEVIAQHAQLGAAHELIVPDATEPGAPSWLPDRKEWLQYRAALYEVAQGVAMGDPACVELAVRFIELRYIGSYSGFIREKLARRLTHAQLTDTQKSRLHRHFEKLALTQERTHEFRAYAKVWRQIITSAKRNELLEKLAAVQGEEAAEWFAKTLQKDEQTAG